MKKIILSLALVLGLILCASTSWALTPIHEAQYLWFYNSDTEAYGTRVDQSFPVFSQWSIGDISGETIVQVREKLWDVNDDGTVGRFSWTVWNDDINLTLLELGYIQSFHIRSYGFQPISVGIPTGWNFEHDGEFYLWYTEDPLTHGIPLGESGMGGFRVDVGTTAWEISNGGVDYLDPVTGEVVILDGNGYWRASHPSPEPASTALLGLGLLGFGGRVFRKRFKA